MKNQICSAEFSSLFTRYTGDFYDLCTHITTNWRKAKHGSILFQLQTSFEISLKSSVGKFEECSGATYGT
jgi:hypothetical protein